MPRRGPVPCGHPMCSALVPYGTKYCEKHQKEHRKDRASAGERGYNSKWQRARRRFLRRPENAFCVRCKAKGTYVKATVVDHIVPHRGDPVLFWDEFNWQPLCKSCHDHKTMTEDREITYSF